MSSQILSYINIIDMTNAQMTNAQESLKLVLYLLILPIFHTFSVHSQYTFISTDFCV